MLIKNNCGVVVVTITVMNKTFDLVMSVLLMLPLLNRLFLYDKKMCCVVTAAIIVMVIKTFVV